MNFRHLLVFQSVMRTHSVSSAAALNGISQPAVSQILKLLEHNLGLPLFVRLKGRLRPTPEAVTLAREVDKILTSCDRMQNVVKDMLDAGSGMVTIATLSYAHVFLPQALGQFQRKLPGTKVVIHVLPTSGIVEMIAQGAAEIGIATDYADPKLTLYKDMCSMDAIAVLPRDSDLADRTVITPADLRGRRILSYDPHSRFGEKATRAFAAENEIFEVSLQAASSTLLCSLVEQGVGIALLEPFILLGPDRFNVVTRLFHPRISMNTRILYSADRPLSIAAQQFKQIFETVLVRRANEFKRISGSARCSGARDRD